MAVSIRMKMLGRKHQPFFRVCVIDRQKARNGREIEQVGTYDPLIKDKSQRAKLDFERIEYWMSVGALPSDRVATLMKKIKKNQFGAAQLPPEMKAPKEAKVAAAPAEGEPEAAEGESAS